MKWVWSIVKWLILLFYRFGFSGSETKPQFLIRKLNLSDHPFGKYAKFSEKLTFLPPDIHTYVCVSGGKKY